MTSPSFSAGSQSPPQPMQARQSSPAERLQQLDELRHEVHADFTRLDKSLADETIMLSDYRDHIHKFYRGLNEREVIDKIHKEEQKIRRGIEHAQREPHHVPVAAVILVLVAIGMASFFIANPGGFTGYLTVPIEPGDFTFDETFIESTTYPLNLTNISGLRATGTLTSGSGELWLLSGEERLLIWQGDAVLNSYSVNTDKESYSLGGEILVSVTPADSSYTLWLTDETGDKTVVQDSFDVVIPGSYELDALINDSGNITKASTSFIVRNDTNTSNDIERSPTIATTEFSNACVETCELTNSEEFSLEVVLEDGATIDITLIPDVPQENSAPIQLQTLPNFEVNEGAVISTDLNQYFEDPDGDTITFDFMNAQGVDISIDGSVMTLTGTSAGASQSLIYASDLYELVQSNPFTITVNAVESEVNVTNTTTVNDTTINTTTQNETPETNTTNTIVPVVPPSIEPINTTLNCTNSDPNLRPMGCLELEGAKYFQDQTIFISDGKRTPLARLTPIGNLLLTGTVHQNAAFSADTNDYVIGYEDDFGRFVTTIWFSKDGNLYLSGDLFEENANDVPPPGSYALRNRKGVTLAWAMQHSGDLYVRGNVIPYRPTITD